MDPRVEKILKLPAYQRVLILCAIVLLVVAGFVYLFYIPKQEEYKSLQKNDVSLQSKLQEDQRIANDLPKFKNEYEKMQRQLEKSLMELPNKKEIPTLLTSIASLAKDQGLDILRFRPMAETSKGFYAEVPVELKLSGSYNELAMFFFLVGDMSRIVNISNLKIGNPKTSDEGEGIRLSVDCLATTFRFIESPSGNQTKGKK